MYEIVVISWSPLYGQHTHTADCVTFQAEFTDC